MTRLVLDCSVAMAWCFVDESSSYAAAALDAFRNDLALVPSLWCHEIANVLAHACRRGRLDEERSRTFVRLLSRLPIEVVEGPTILGVTESLDLALKANLTAHDAAYLDLAQKTGLPLASLDRTLIAAARKARAPVFEPG